MQVQEVQISTLNNVQTGVFSKKVSDLPVVQIPGSSRRDLLVSYDKSDFTYDVGQSDFEIGSDDLYHRVVRLSVKRLA